MPNNCLEIAETELSKTTIVIDPHIEMENAKAQYLMGKKTEAFQKQRRAKRCAGIYTRRAKDAASREGGSPS